jgi:flagellar hook-associated protein 2
MGSNPAITFGGLASGIDTNALIDGLMGVERIPLTRNQSKQQTITAAKGTLSSVLNAFSAVKTAAAALNTESAFASYKITSSEEKTAVATATGSAKSGTYSVEVKAVAAESRAKSSAFADATSALGQEGTFAVSVGGATKTIDVLATDSLATLATKINSSGASVNASVVKTGTVAHLVISGKNTGSLNEVTFAETGTAALGMTTYQSAADAKIKLDDQFTIERATNQFTDVLDGVTITAKTVSATPVSISVKSDPDAQASKIQGFVDAFNNAISSGHLAAGWGSIKASNTELSGDSSVRSALSLLGTTVSNTVPGLTGKYNQLATVGVKLSQNGTLSLDKTKLAAALEADPEGVAKLFIGDSATSTKGAMSIMTTAIDRITKATTGTIAVRLTQFDNQLKRLSSDYDALQRRLDSYEAGLRKKFTALETTVSNIQYQGKQLSGFVSNSTNNNG